MMIVRPLMIVGPSMIAQPSMIIRSLPILRRWLINRRWLITGCLLAAVLSQCLWCALAADRPQAAKAIDPAEAAQREAKLIEVLNSDAPKAEKAITCKRLAIYGSGRAVPALAPLLADSELASWARIALEAIPDAAADATLREAAVKLQGRLLVGVINSLGVRRDAKAVDVLTARLKDADAEVASAAAAALGRIGGQAAVEALQKAIAAGNVAVRSAAAEGLILCAERALATGNRHEAIALFDLVRKADVPKQRVLEATRGAILARQSEGAALLAELLQSADRDSFALGLRVAREMHPAAVAQGPLLDALVRAAPNRKALLIYALADCGDPMILAVIQQQVRGAPADVRVAAIRATARLGGAWCIPALLEAAADEDHGVSRTAIEALAELRGVDVDREILAQLKTAQGKERRLLIEVIGQRYLVGATPELLKAAEDADAQVRIAALGALGATVDFEQLPVLIKRVATEVDNSDEAKAAQQALTIACSRMPDREACAQALADEMAPSAPPAKIRFLEVLGELGGSKALQTVVAATKDPNAQVQDAAVRVLGEWMTPDAAPALLELASSAKDGKLQTRALRGYIRVARQLEVPTPERIAMCAKALPLCQRDDERRLVLEVLRRYPSAEGIALAAGLLQHQQLKEEAASAVVAIAEKIGQREPAAVAQALKQVIAASVGQDATQKAQSLLDQANRRLRTSGR